MIDVNVSFTKTIGFLVMSCAKIFPSKKDLIKTINLLPFVDKKERYNVFSNVLRILFDLPSMNFHFLRYLSPICEKVN